MNVYELATLYDRIMERWHAQIKSKGRTPLLARVGPGSVPADTLGRAALGELLIEDADEDIMNNLLDGITIYDGGPSESEAKIAFGVGEHIPTELFGWLEDEDERVPVRAILGEVKIQKDGGYLAVYGIDLDDRRYRRHYPCAERQEHST